MLSSIGAELGKDQFKGVEMRELNDTCPFYAVSKVVTRNGIYFSDFVCFR